MYIAFDGGNDDLALAALGLAGGGNLGLDGLECGLGSRGGLQQLRQKDETFLELSILSSLTSLESLIIKMYLNLI